MCAVEAHKAKEGVVQCQNLPRLFLEPVTSNCEVTVNICRLPCITCAGDQTLKNRALVCVSSNSRKNLSTHRKSVFKIAQMPLELFYNL